MRIAVITAVMLTLFAVGGSGAPGNVNVCHFPPDNPANFHTIVVASSAVAAQLAHGDQLGTCEEVGPSPLSLVVFGSLMLGWALLKFRKAPIFDRS
jgi:hypothetical protein